MNEWVHQGDHSYFANSEGVVIWEIFLTHNNSLWHACDYTHPGVKVAATCISLEHAIAWLEKQK